MRLSGPHPPRKACPTAGRCLLQAILLGQIKQHDEGEAGSSSALTFLGGPSHTGRSSLLADKPEELGVLQSSAANGLSPFLALPSHAGLLWLPHAQLCPMVHGKAHPPLQLLLTLQEGRQPGPPLPAGVSKSPHCESPHKACTKIIHELSKLKHETSPIQL